jgi:hypothetical protein
VLNPRDSSRYVGAIFQCRQHRASPCMRCETALSSSRPSAAVFGVLDRARRARGPLCSRRSDTQTVCPSATWALADKRSGALSNDRSRLLPSSIQYHRRLLQLLGVHGRHEDEAGLPERSALDHSSDLNRTPCQAGAQRPCVSGTHAVFPAPHRKNPRDVRRRTM